MKHCSTQEPATKTVKKYFAAFLLTLLVPLLAAEADVADGVRVYDAGWYEDALAEFLPAAEAGDRLAQLALASMYQFGEGAALLGVTHHQPAPALAVRARRRLLAETQALEHHFGLYGPFQIQAFAHCARRREQVVHHGEVVLHRGLLQGRAR